MYVYARNLLAMDVCGLDSDTARRLAGDKVGFCILPFGILYFSLFGVIIDCL